MLWFAQRAGPRSESRLCVSTPQARQTFNEASIQSPCPFMKNSGSLILRCRECSLKTPIDETVTWLHTCSLVCTARYASTRPRGFQKKDRENQYCPVQGVCPPTQNHGFSPQPGCPPDYVIKRLHACIIWLPHGLHQAQLSLLGSKSISRYRYFSETMYS